MDPIVAFHHHLPEIVLCLSAMVILILGTHTQPLLRSALPYLALAALAGSTAALDWSTGGFAVFARLVVLMVGTLILLAYWPDLDAQDPGEFLSAILFSLGGALLLVGADDLITLFLGLELVSLPTLLLIAAGRRHLEAQEAAAKYFFLSVLSAGVLLYGFSFLYGVTATVRLTPTDPKAAATARADLDAATARHLRLQFMGGATADQLQSTQDDLTTRRYAAWQAADDLPTRASYVLSQGGTPLSLLVLGLVLTIGGLCFKLAAVPFHFYAPDVYQGSQSVIAGLMAFVPKAAGVFALLKLGVVALAPLALISSDTNAPADSPAQVSSVYLTLMAILAAATMTLGNLMAVLQTNIKRMLAYSSIAHSGYLLVTTAALIDQPDLLWGSTLTSNGGAALLFYLLVYGVMTLGAFAVLALLRTPSGEPVESLDDLAGLARRQPAAAAIMALFCWSLTGLPPTAGFLGKLALFGSALAGSAGHSGSAPDTLYFLVALAVVNSAISAYYYLGVVSAMYLREPLGPIVAIPSSALRLSLGLCAALTLAWGVAPNLFGAATSALRAGESLHQTLHRTVPVPASPATTPDIVSPPALGPQRSFSGTTGR